MSDKKQVLLAVSAPPFWHCGRTIRSFSLHTLLALAPAAVLAVMQWGIPAARVMALAMLAAVLTETACRRAMGAKMTWGEDGTSAITGLLLAFLLPASAPWWIVVLGAAGAVGIGRMAFGGYGANPVCATLVGWALIYVSYPLPMDASATLLSTDLIDPLAKLRAFGADAVGLSSLDLLLGRQLGGLGAAQSGAILLGGIYIAARGIVHWQIPAAFLLGTAATASVFWIADPAAHAGPLFHIFGGSTMLAAFFLATEGSCSPHRVIPMWIFGLIGGALVVIIRTFGSYPDGAPFAVMLINLLAPMCSVIPTFPFGYRNGGRR
ncbi:MAG: RnfABCDGE type electron transport complex subunit D [Mailhella sp.]|nr:RnfABCDGE type electron transport complex subunit D [Mailhella sp.]